MPRTNDEAIGNTGSRIEPEHKTPLASLGNTATAVSSVANVGVQVNKVAVENAANNAEGVSEQPQLLNISNPKLQTANFNIMQGSMLKGAKTHLDEASSENKKADEGESTANKVLNISFAHQAQVSGAAVSAGLVTWALNSGGILSSVMAGVPSWKNLDPISLLDNSAGDKPELDTEDEYEDSVTDMLSE